MKYTYVCVCVCVVAVLSDKLFSSFERTILGWQLWCMNEWIGTVHSSESRDMCEESVCNMIARGCLRGVGPTLVLWMLREAWMVSKIHTGDFGSTVGRDTIQDLGVAGTRDWVLGQPGMGCMADWESGRTTETVCGCVRKKKPGSLSQHGSWTYHSRCND